MQHLVDVEKKFTRDKAVISIAYFFSDTLRSAIIITSYLGNKHFVDGSYYNNPETEF